MIFLLEEAMLLAVGIVERTTVQAVSNVKHVCVCMSGEYMLDVD